MNTVHNTPVRITLHTYTHNYNGNSQEFFSFDFKGTDGPTLHSNWMTVVDGVVHDAFYGIDDNTHIGEMIPTSPLVSIPTTCCSGYENYEQRLLPLILAEISEYVGFAVNVPMICEALGVEQIRTLKEDRGYVLESNDYYFIAA